MRDAHLYLRCKPLKCAPIYEMLRIGVSYTPVCKCTGSDFSAAITQLYISLFLSTEVHRAIHRPRSSMKCDVIEKDTAEEHENGK